MTGPRLCSVRFLQVGRQIRFCRRERRRRVQRVFWTGWLDKIL